MNWINIIESGEHNKEEYKKALVAFYRQEQAEFQKTAALFVELSEEADPARQKILLEHYFNLEVPENIAKFFTTLLH